MSAKCSVCDGGQMTPTRVYRMSNPVVVIGYILLIPSIIMVLCFGGCTIMGAGGTGAAASEASDQYTAKKEEAKSMITKLGYSEDKADQILAEESHVLSTIDMSDKYPEEHKATLASALELDSTANAEMAGAGIGTAAAGLGVVFGVIMTIISFVGGLLGWLLIMKKKVLKCGGCSHTVDAA